MVPTFHVHGHYLLRCSSLRYINQEEKNVLLLFVPKQVHYGCSIAIVIMILGLNVLICYGYSIYNNYISIDHAVGLICILRPTMGGRRRYFEVLATMVPAPWSSVAPKLDQVCQHGIQHHSSYHTSPLWPIVMCREFAGFRENSF